MGSASPNLDTASARQGSAPIEENGIEQSYSHRMTITTLNDLEPAARNPAEKLVRLLTGYEPTGEEPLMAIFEWALERLSAPGNPLEQR